MSKKARERLQAISEHLAPVKTVAGPSAGPRAKGLVVIITGANSTLGIGRATALQFAENGARAIYVCDFDATNLASNKKEIESSFPDVEVHARQFDAADEKSVKEVVGHAVQSYGRLDVFFANAGIAGPHVGFGDITDEQFMQIMRTNSLSCFLAAKYAAPAMRLSSAAGKTKPGGSIILTASVAGLRSNAGSTPYSASKAAVVSVAQTTAYQLAGTGVRVNALCPGLIETGITRPMYEAARQRGTEARIGQLNPLQRGGQADEVARVVLFLGSDEGSYVNGQAWAVDGGLSAGLPFVPGKLS